MIIILATMQTRLITINTILCVQVKKAGNWHQQVIKHSKDKRQKSSK